MVLFGIVLAMAGTSSSSSSNNNNNNNVNNNSMSSSSSSLCENLHSSAELDATIHSILWSLMFFQEESPSNGSSSKSGGQSSNDASAEDSVDVSEIESNDYEDDDDYTFLLPGLSQLEMALVPILDQANLSHSNIKTIFDLIMCQNQLILGSNRTSARGWCMLAFKKGL